MNDRVYLLIKWMGDLLSISGLASMAIRYYQEALGQKEIKEEEVGRLYHNMGVAEAKLFRFENAKINFIKAYQYTGEESSLFYYYCIMALADGIEAAGEELKTFEDSDFLLDAFEEQFAAFEEDFAYSAMAEKYRKIVFLDENGKPEEALAKKQRLVSALKKDFRKEIDI